MEASGDALTLGSAIFSFFAALAPIPTIVLNPMILPFMCGQIFLFSVIMLIGKYGAKLEWKWAALIGYLIQGCIFFFIYLVAFRGALALLAGT